ncbi:uncharacterized protein LOC143915983 [Arctopsyche grandis]|uniref:uncharacterized protein LOC143915983 n=1 Tax=Arctopsyche grandis TaxID=121162 RepID=UPI00406D8469
MKIFICLALLAAVTASPSRTRRGVIQQDSKSDGESLGASGFHHEVQHEHAKSHQSVKLEHFHPVPVYIKKEHSHLLKHPLSKGKSGHGIKLLHPKTEHQHGYGLVLEEHRHDLESQHHGLGDHGFSEHSDDASQIEHIPEHHEFQGAEGGESHGWAAGSEEAPAYETKGFEGHYQFNPVDMSQYAGHEAEGGESY